jgi:adenosylcobinamide-phosphate synthase
MDHHTVLLLCALALNAVFGGPKRVYDALGFSRLSFLPARAVLHLERKLNRESRSAADREWRGWVMAAAAILFGLVLGGIGHVLFQGNLRFIELLLVAVLLPVRPIRDRAAAIRLALFSGNVPAARQALAGTPWKHHALLDEYGVARAAIETLAVEFSEKLVCPVLGYLWLGLPGLFVCKLLTMLRDSLIHAPDFGKGARLSHSVLHTLPARLSTVLWLVTPMLLPSGDSAKAAKQVTKSFLDDGPRAHNVRMAAAVTQVSLGGPASPYLTQWATSGSPKALPADIRRAQASYLLATLFLFLLAGAFF